MDGINSILEINNGDVNMKNYIILLTVLCLTGCAANPSHPQLESKLQKEIYSKYNLLTPSDVTILNIEGERNYSYLDLKYKAKIVDGRMLNCTSKYVHDVTMIIGLDYI
ncbi:hypothetical protein AH97_23140, partial [Salmonella enterica subsp. enterica]|nr:hypothetical protein [Salmonella enterica subsp. enterica serovar Hartford]